MPLAKGLVTATTREDWPTTSRKIAQTHIARITAIPEDPANTQEKQAFQCPPSCAMT
ncbi:MAG: hypothetical protein U1F05_11570 [Burkholderiales bacterium]